LRRSGEEMMVRDWKGGEEERRRRGEKIARKQRKKSYREMRPLFLAAARPMNVEWKINPYLGVLPRVLRALLS
jgi:hypothetical protein